MGTSLVADLAAGAVSSGAAPVAVLGNDLIVFGTDSHRGIEAWRYTAP